MRELALFAGVGGGLLGTKILGWQTVCYVELDTFCIEVIKARIQDGYLDDAPIWDDVRTFDGKTWRGEVDIITAGFPCQPFSASGRRLAGEDSRNMWPHTLRVIREVGPRFVYLENVPGLRFRPHKYVERILGDLAAGGYIVQWGSFPAAALGAPHFRERLWLVAYAGCDVTYRFYRLSKERRDLGYFKPPGEPLDWNSIRFDGSRDFYRESPIQPFIRRVDDGMADRVDRLKAIGNGQVPAVVRFVWEVMTAGDERQCG